MISSTILIQIEQHLGAVTYPLLLCSLLASCIIIERLCMLIYFTTSSTLQDSASRFISQHEQNTRTLREELAMVWLDAQQRRLLQGLRLLQICAVLAPLLGLLGTVLGLIQVFHTLAALNSPLQPQDLAQGLGIAMKTTAAGLGIAIPALAAGYGLRLWAERIIQQLQNRMNEAHFALDGIRLDLAA